MNLSDTKCRSQKPADKPLRLADGGCLYLEVMPNGSKFWRQKYRYANKEKRLTHGAYPMVTLSEARELREAAKKLLQLGHDPASVKRTHKATLTTSSLNTFEVVAHDGGMKQM